jgi:Sigma-70, region 4/SnoaL-like domain
MADSLSLAMLVLLDNLSPEQRAVLLLHDVFDYDYATVADIIGKSPDNVRQLARRARRHVQEGRPRFHATRDQQEELARRFVAAMEEGDLAGLEALLAQDVVLTGDGGGRAPAPLRPLHGSSAVARALLRWMEAISGAPDIRLQPTEVNGGVGGLLLDGQARVVGVWAFEIGRERIRDIKAIVNSQKLAHLGPTTELGSLVSPQGSDDP